MVRTSIDELKFKELVKAALIEVLEERRELVREVLEEALEDIALLRAIEEGERTDIVTKSEVFRVIIESV